MKIELHDTFNGCKISSHNSLRGAVRAQRKHLAAVKKSNGKNSYLTYAFRFSDGTPVDGDAIMQEKMDLDQSR